MDEEQLAHALGWFGLGLGLALLTVPGSMARVIGVKDAGGTRTLLRVVGLREVASGVGILTTSRPAGWLWARVAGDAMDLALLGSSLTSGTADQNRTSVATASVVGIAALDTYSSRLLSRRATGTTIVDRGRKNVDVKRAITIKRTPAELYAFWHDFQNLPRFMQHLNAVTVTGDRKSHWVAKGPAGAVVEWDAEITQDQPDRLIAWQSLEGAAVKNGGVVRFVPAPGDRGTEVHVEFTYEPPLGPLGAAVAKIFGEEPKDQVDDDLQHFKQVMETGEVIQSDASARGGGPAQPVAIAASR